MNKVVNRGKNIIRRKRQSSTRGVLVKKKERVSKKFKANKKQFGKRGKELGGRGGEKKKKPKRTSPGYVPRGGALREEDEADKWTTS